MTVRLLTGDDDNATRYRFSVLLKQKIFDFFFRQNYALVAFDKLRTNTNNGFILKFV